MVFFNKGKQMLRVRTTVITMFLLLLLGLTFNAYACLIPIYDASQMAGDSDCTTPQQQSARQFCDTFKTMGFNAPEPQVFPATQAEFIEHAATLSVFLAVPFHVTQNYYEYKKSPPRDLLLKTATLRI
jgi:hypothetical protein